LTREIKYTTSLSRFIRRRRGDRTMYVCFPRGSRMQLHYWRPPASGPMARKPPGEPQEACIDFVIAWMYFWGQNMWCF